MNKEQYKQKFGKAEVKETKKNKTCWYKDCGYCKKYRTKCFNCHTNDYEDKSCEYYIGEPKNGKCRNFPMNSEIKELFERIKTVQAENGITNEYVFANVDGRVNSHTISCAMSRRCEDAGIDKRSVHAIRRTVSSHLRTKLPRAKVANMLGHLEETNEKHYNYDVTPTETKVTSLNEIYKSFKDVA